MAKKIVTAKKTSKKSTKATDTVAAAMEQAQEAITSQGPQGDDGGPAPEKVVAKGSRKKSPPKGAGEPEQVTGPTATDLAEMALSHGAAVMEQAAFYKIQWGSRRVYIAKSKRGITRIDLAGFTVEHPAVEQLSEEDAKAAKLGRVRGQIFPSRSEGWLEAYGMALEQMVATTATKAEVE